jgi:hypothetical protein
MNDKTCTRTDCGKKLRNDNSSGKCSSSCRSPEAPPSLRAEGVQAAVKASPTAPALTPPRVWSAAPTDTVTLMPLAKFRMVAEAIGKDPAAILNEFAQAWLDGLAEKLEDV